MGRVFSAMIDLQVDTTKAQTSIKALGDTKTTIPLSLEAKQAKAQAEGMLSLVDRIDRKTARPKVDGTGLSKAKAQAESLDKSLDKATRARRLEIQGALNAFSSGATMRGGGIGGLASGLSGLAGASGVTIAAMAGGAAAAAAGAAAAGMVSLGMQADSRARLESFAGRAYGAGGSGFVQAAKQLQESTGYMADDFLRAALVGKTLSNNYGLQYDQVKKLVEVSADLAATSPYEDIQTVSNAMERLQSAVRGEAEASERLGLTLNDTYMKNIAAAGAYRQTWSTMNDLEKAQARYREILVQTQDVLGAAAEGEGLTSQWRKFKSELAETGVILGTEIAPALGTVLSSLNEFLDRVPEWVWRMMGSLAAAPVGGGGESGYGGAATIPEIIINSRAGSLPLKDAYDEYGNYVPDAQQWDITAPEPKAKPWWQPRIVENVPVGGPQYAAVPGVTVVLRNESGVPLRVQDARSYDVSNV